MEEWLSFDGNSGPYLMYSYARTRSILRKAREQGVAVESRPELATLLNDPAEKELLRYVYDFVAMAERAAETYRPSLLTHYLFEMCKSYNRFYAAVSVLKAETDDLRSARLALITAFSETLKKGLGLLGMTPPERM